MPEAFIVESENQRAIQLIQTPATPSQPLISDLPGKLKSQDELVSEAIIEERPIGEFKSADCQEIIKRRFPMHIVAAQSGASCGEYIAKGIWPLLEARGVELIGEKPRRYRITQAAKDSLK